MTNIGKWAVYEDPHCYEHYIGLVVVEHDGIVAGRDENDIPWACETNRVLGATESKEVAARAVTMLDNLDIEDDSDVVAAEDAFEAVQEAGRAANQAAEDAVRDACAAARRRAVLAFLASPEAAEEAA